jgi:hypothetical protein
MRVSVRQNLLPEKRGFVVKRKRLAVEQIVAVLQQAERVESGFRDRP